jgi:hypothetical protein
MALGSGNSSGLKTLFGGAHGDGVAVVDQVAAANIKGREEDRNDLNLGILASMNDDPGLLAGRRALGAAAAGVAAETAAEQKKKAEQQFQDRMYQLLQDRIRDLDRSMAEAADRLRLRYGDDFIGGMSARYLTEEQLSGAHTDDERLALLADRFLERDANGEFKKDTKGHYIVKEEYRGTDEAGYVADWAERQVAVDLAHRVNAANGNLDPVLSQELETFNREAGIGDRRAFTENSTSAPATATVTAGADRIITASLGNDW